MNDTNKGRLKWIRLLEEYVEQYAIFALLLLQLQQITVQRTVRIDRLEAYVPLVNGIVDELNRVHILLERIGSINIT